VRRGPAVELALIVTWATAGACTPAVGDEPAPEFMQWDPAPPRVPSPTGLIVNPTTGLVDFSRAGISVSQDCAAQQSLPEAACEFEQYLQTLDGFPTVTPAAAPASAQLDPTTLTLGDNVLALTASGAAITNVEVGFDDVDFLTVTPTASWDLGASYWFAVRGYDHGVRTMAGGEVVGSPTQFLLKQERPLDCGVSDPSQLDRSCPAYDLLLGQGLAPADAAKTLASLEQARLAYLRAGAWDLVAAAGIPKSEVAVLWGFPIHTQSVAEVSPPAIVPQITAANQIRVAVHGPVDATTVSPFVAKQQSGSVVLMDLDDVLKKDLVNGLPQVDAQLVDGSIVITGAAPFSPGHNVGVFFTNAIHDDQGRPLVPSPVSVLLTLQGSLVDADGNSTVSGVSDADAATLEPGRQKLAGLFENTSLVGLTGVDRSKLVYCFAFPFEPPP
jgi:hypothetical protein